MICNVRLIPVLATFMIACGAEPTTPTPTILRVVTDQGTYLAGGTGEVRILNVSGGPVSYNECERSLDRYDQGTWVAVSWRDSLAVNCVDILRTLGVGAEISVAFRLLDGLSAGTYRWRFDEIRMDDGGTPLPIWERVSTPFLVEP